MNSEKTLLVAWVLSMVIAVCLGLRTQARTQTQSTSHIWKPPTTNGALIFPASTETTPSLITLADKGQTIVAIHSDGRVEFGEGFAGDTAAREFWRILGRVWVSDQCLPLTVHDAPKPGARCAPGYIETQSFAGKHGAVGYVCEAPQKAP